MIRIALLLCLVGLLDGSTHAADRNWDDGNEGGKLAPGASPDLTNITGGYTQQADGTTEIEIEGPTPVTNYDKVTVSGDADLQGLLDIDLGTFEPNYFVSFEIMTANQITGKFDLVTGAEVDENKTLAAIYGSGDVTLIAAIPGDGNLDGVVNFDDFVLITNNFESNNTFFGEGNYNQDFTTNFDDFVILTNHFELEASQLGPTGAAGPEPGAWLLLGIAGVFSARRQT